MSEQLNPKTVVVEARRSGGVVDERADLTGPVLYSPNIVGSPKNPEDITQITASIGEKVLAVMKVGAGNGRSELGDLRIYYYESVFLGNLEPYVFDRMVTEAIKQWDKVSGARPNGRNVRLRRVVATTVDDDGKLSDLLGLSAGDEGRVTAKRRPFSPRVDHRMDLT